MENHLVKYWLLVVVKLTSDDVPFSLIIFFLTVFKYVVGLLGVDFVLWRG